MDNLYIEERSLAGKISVSQDLVHHLYTRRSPERIAIVSEKPAELLASTRKQWFKLLRHVQRERARTLKSARIIELSNQITWMHQITFACQKSPEAPLACDVSFATAEAFLQAPPECSTLYVLDAVNEADLAHITSRMPRGGVLVVYRD